jgi:hypothetical protein
MYYIKYLDMFRAIVCPSSGGQNCIFTASGMSLSVSGRAAHGRSQRVSLTTCLFALSVLLWFLFGIQNLCVYTHYSSLSNSITSIHFSPWVIHSFNHSAVLRHVHSLFQIEFTAECDLVLPLSISSILSFA